MKLEELEAKVRKLEELEAKIRTLEDIEEIKKLQRSYGYYLTHGMGQEIGDLFSDSPDVSVEALSAKHIGKAVKSGSFSSSRKHNPEALLNAIQSSGIVDVDPDGKTAKGRWFGFGFQASPTEGGVYANYFSGVYENEYVKEDGKWKFKKLEYRLIFNLPFGECWVKPERRVKERVRPDAQRTAEVEPNITDDEKYPTRYPSGRILPFHYKHPVTGQGYPGEIVTIQGEPFLKR